MAIEWKEFIPVNVIIILPKTYPWSNRDAHRDSRVNAPHSCHGPALNQLEGWGREREPNKPIRAKRLEGFLLNIRDPLFPGGIQFKKFVWVWEQLIVLIILVNSIPIVTSLELLHWSTQSHGLSRLFPILSGLAGKEFPLCPEPWTQWGHDCCPTRNVHPWGQCSFPSFLRQEHKLSCSHTWPETSEGPLACAPLTVRLLSCPCPVAQDADFCPGEPGPRTGTGSARVATGVRLLCTWGS